MKVVVVGRCDYLDAFDAMRRFNDSRDESTPDELWLCEHAPVYTLGVAGRGEHLRDTRGIPVVPSNRGGQVTYHGPGQVVVYPLVDLRRCQLHVKTYVYRLEQAALRFLESHGVTGHRVRGAPGVYVRVADPFGHARLAPPETDDGRLGFDGLGKIAALGIKVSRHCAYHGMALNVAMDLEPFARIDPCGYPGLAAIDLATLGVPLDWTTAAIGLAERVVTQLGHDERV